MKKVNDKKINNNLSIIIGVLVACILLSLGSVYFLMSKNIIKFGSHKVENAYVDAGEFSVKLKNEDKGRYFKGQVYVGYDKHDSNCKEQLVKEKQISIASEAINSYLRKQSYEYLNDLDNIENIKSDILEEVNEQLTTCKVTDIRFYNYLLQ